MRERAERAAAVAVAERGMAAWASTEKHTTNTSAGAVVDQTLEFVPPPGAEVALVFPCNGDFDDFVAATMQWGGAGDAASIPSAALPAAAAAPGQAPPPIGMNDCLTLPVLQALQRRATESNPASVATAHAHGVALRYALPAPVTAVEGVSTRERQFLETFHIDPTAYRALRRRLSLLRYRSEGPPQGQTQASAAAEATAATGAAEDASIAWLRRILLEARTLDSAALASTGSPSESLDAVSPYLLCDDDVRALCDMNVMQVRATLRFLQAEGVIATAAVFRCRRECF
jgi:hypothetical protein